MKKENIKKAVELNDEIEKFEMNILLLKGNKGEIHKIKLRNIFNGEHELELNLDLLLEENIKILQQKKNFLKKELSKILK